MAGAGFLIGGRSSRLEWAVDVSVFDVALLPTVKRTFGLHMVHSSISVALRIPSRHVCWPDLTLFARWKYINASQRIDHGPAGRFARSFPTQFKFTVGVENLGLLQTDVVGEKRIVRRWFADSIQRRI